MSILQTQYLLLMLILLVVILLKPKVSNDGIIIMMILCGWPTKEAGDDFLRRVNMILCPN